MDPSESVVQEKKPSPLADIGGWINKHVADSDTDGDATPAAAPAPAQAQAQAPLPEPESASDDGGGAEWWERGISSTHGFLKGKTGPQVEEMFRHAERKILEGGTERRASAERELQQLRAERDTWRASQTPPADAIPKKEAGEDPRMEQVRDMQFSDPEKSLALLRQINKDDARAVMAEEWDRRDAEQKRAASIHETATTATVAATSARAKVAKLYGVSEAIAHTMILEGVNKQLAPHVAESGDSTAWGFEENYLIACKGIYGPPTVAIDDVPPLPVEAKDPPGSKTSAKPATRKPPAASSLTQEQRDARASIAEELANSSGISINKDRFMRGR